MFSWWRHQMETFSALLAICAGNSPVPGEFPAQRPVTRSFDVFFDLRLNKRLSKQSRGWWFGTLSCPLWCYCNVESIDPKREWLAKCFIVYWYSVTNLLSDLYTDVMVSWNESIFPVTGLLCEEITGYRWIPPTKASDAELWCYFWSAPCSTIE